MSGNLVKNVKKGILIFVALLVANVLSSFVFGIIVTIGGNIERVGVGLTNLNFDPMITIAYMILYYFVTLFHQPSGRAQYYLFLFTLMLSFTVPFMQGALYLVFLYFILRKARVI